MSTSTKVPLKWLAGFFDGEGSVWKYSNSSGMVLAIYQKDVSVLRKISKIYGGSFSNRLMKPSKWDKRTRRMGRIVWWGQNAVRLAKRVRPYLLTDKAKKIDKLFRLLGVS